MAHHRWVPRVGGDPRFGAGLGRAFQIRDDYLGIWGNPAATGKAIGNDIRRRKKSYPVVHALERAGGAAQAELQRIYAQPELTEEDVARALAVMDEAGSPAAAQRATEESARASLAALQGVDLPAWARREAAELVDFLAHRQY